MSSISLQVADGGRKIWARLTRRDLRDIATVLALGVLLLPLLPDRTVDPLEAINPRRLGTLAVALMAVSVGANLGLRHLGPMSALALTGFAGGFVSSTATVAALADRAREATASALCLSGAALLSNVAMILQLGLVMWMLSPALFSYCLVPLICAATVATGAATALGWRSLRAASGLDGLGVARPVNLKAVLAFVALIVILLLAANLAGRWLGEGSLPWVLGLSGIGDVHAATASAAQMVAGDRISTGVAMQAITIALAANSMLKCVIAGVRGGWRFATPLLAGTLLMIGAFAIAAGTLG